MSVALPSCEKHSDRVSEERQDSKIRGWEQMRWKNREERYNAGRGSRTAGGPSRQGQVGRLRSGRKKAGPGLRLDQGRAAARG